MSSQTIGSRIEKELNLYFGVFALKSIKKTNLIDLSINIDSRTDTLYYLIHYFCDINSYRT